MLKESNKVLSIDSDILRFMAEIEELNSLTKKEKIHKIKNAKDASWDRIVAVNAPDMTLQHLIELLLKSVKDGKLSLFVSPPVYYECRHNKMALEFIKNYAVCPSIKETKPGHFEMQGAAEVEKLAQLYTTGRSVTKNADKDAGVGDKAETATVWAMQQEFNAQNLSYKPTNDAYIMAWSTVYGYDLLTNNTHDYIQFPKEMTRTHYDMEKEYAKIRPKQTGGYSRINYKYDKVITRKTSRRDLIKEINIENGYNCTLPYDLFDLAVQCYDAQTDSLIFDNRNPNISLLSQMTDALDKLVPVRGNETDEEENLEESNNLTIIEE